MQKLPPLDTEALKTWFQKEKRSLPWRAYPTPYAVWVSEIMLQQTQASVVKDYFLRWMERFPTIDSLASASLEEVIKMWEGLGYYSRARNLHQAAQFLVDQYAGQLPSTREELSNIKGLGPYTIGAILSFAFQKKAAAVDGNVVRVLTRYFAITDDIQHSSTKKNIWQIAENILPDVEPWIVTEALIELGATVCKRDPDCAKCPLQKNCGARLQGLQKEIPKKEKKVEITPLFRNVFVIVYEGEVLLQRGQEGKVMAGLYEFPYVDREKKGFPFPLSAKKIANLPEAEHHFTRYKVTLYPALWKALERIELPDYDWISWQKIKQYPFSSGHRRILKDLDNGKFTAHFTH